MPWISTGRGFASPTIKIAEQGTQATATMQFPFSEASRGFYGRAQAATNQMSNYLLDVANRTHTQVELKPAFSGIGGTLTGATIDVKNAVQLLNSAHAQLQSWVGQEKPRWIHDGSW